MQPLREGGILLQEIGLRIVFMLLPLERVWGGAGCRCTPWLGTDSLVSIPRGVTEGPSEPAQVYRRAAWMSFPPAAETWEGGSQRAGCLLPPPDTHQGPMLPQWPFATPRTSHLRSLRSSCGSCWCWPSRLVFSSPPLLCCILGEQSSVWFFFSPLGNELRELVVP